MFLRSNANLPDYLTTLPFVQYGEDGLAKLSAETTYVIMT